MKLKHETKTILAVGVVVACLITIGILSNYYVEINNEYLRLMYGG